MHRCLVREAAHRLAVFEHLLHAYLLICEELHVDEPVVDLLTVLADVQVLLREYHAARVGHHLNHVFDDLLFDVLDLVAAGGFGDALFGAVAARASAGGAAASAAHATGISSFGTRSLRLLVGLRASRQLLLGQLGCITLRLLSKVC